MKLKAEREGEREGGRERGRERWQEKMCDGDKDRKCEASKREAETARYLKENVYSSQNSSRRGGSEINVSAL